MMTTECSKASWPNKLRMNFRVFLFSSVKSEGFTNSSRTFGPGGQRLTQVFISFLSVSSDRLKMSGVFTTVNGFPLHSPHAATHRLVCDGFWWWKVWPLMMKLASLVCFFSLFPSRTILNSDAVKQQRERKNVIKSPGDLCTHLQTSMFCFNSLCQHFVIIWCVIILFTVNQIMFIFSC